MRKVLFLVLPLFFLAGVVVPPAEAHLRWHRVGGGPPPDPPPPGLCPQGTYSNAEGVSDGCPGAPVGTPDNVTLFQQTNYFGAGGYAAQSGQVYTTRPPWNVAGADYPVGIPAGVILKDPYTEYLLGNFPAGCVVGQGAPYNTSGNANGYYVRCANMSSNLTIDGYDMSGARTGTNRCYVIQLSTTVGNTYDLNYRNNYHGRKAGCIGTSNSNFAIQMFPGEWKNLNFDNDVWDYSPRATGSGSGYIPISGGGTSAQNWKFRYSIFKNIPQNPLNGNMTNFSFSARYTWFDSWVFDVSNQNHAETTNFNGGGTRSLFEFQFVNALRGNNPGRGSGTAVIWPSAATPNGGRFTSTKLRNNVTIANCDMTLAPDGSGPCRVVVSAAFAKSEAQALAFFGNQHDAAEVTDNYTDYSGASQILRANGAYCAIPMVVSGNKDLVSGGAFGLTDSPFNSANGYISGTTLNFTTNVTTYNGMAITGAGVTPGTVIVSGAGGFNQSGPFTVNNSQTVGSVGSPVALQRLSGCS